MPSRGRNNWLEAEAQDGLAGSQRACSGELQGKVGKACMDIIIGLLLVTSMTRLMSQERFQMAPSSPYNLPEV